MKFCLLRHVLTWFRLPGLVMATTVLTVLLHSSLGFLHPVMATTAAAIIPHSQPETPQLLGQLDNAQSLLEQGRDYYTKEQFHEAASLWAAAEKQFIGQGDALNQAMALSNLALAHRQLGQWPEADAAIGRSLQLLDDMTNLSQSGLRIYGQTLNTQGSLYWVQGRAEQALASWEQATENYTRADYAEGVVKSLINQTYALRSLGFFRESRSRLSQIEGLLTEQTDLTLKVALTRSLGETQRLMGDLNASKVLLEESLQLSKMLLPVGKELAVTQLSLGNTLHLSAQRQETFARRTQEKTDWDKVDRLYQEALDTYAEISDDAPLLTQIQARLNRFDISSHQNDWATVESLRVLLPSQLKALPVSRASTFSHMRLANLLLDSCRPDIADCPFERKDLRQQAYSLLATAKQQAEDLQDPMAESYALGYLGHLYELEDRDLDAQQLTEAASQLASDQPSLVYQWEWQLGRIESKLQRHRERVLSHYDRAFQNVQIVRRDLLHVGPDVQFDFRNNIEPLYREYISLLLPKETRQFHNDPTELVRAQTVIDDLRVAELESFLACGLIEPDDNIPRASIQQVANIDQTTAIIYPIILPDGPGEERLEVLLQLPGGDSGPVVKRYSPKNIRPAAGGVDHNDRQFSNIENTLKQFRRELERPYDYVLPESAQLISAALYDWLVRPAAEAGWLDSMDTLVFVLDGAFRNVPMAALYDRQTQKFLIEKYAIALTFGDLEIPQAPPETSFRVLAAGLSAASYLPTAAGSTSPPAVSNRNGARPFDSLPFVEPELAAIADIIQTTEPLLNKAFQKKTVQAEMRSSDYNIVHFATHGLFGFTRDDTFLLVAAETSDTAGASDAPRALNPAPNSSGPQGIQVEKINLNDFDSLLRTRNQTPLELLVLSACETATGDSREVLGIAGLAVQSGARSTLATLWSVKDESTSTLIKAFYEQLVNQGVSKAKALQKAQIKLLSQNPHPSTWAPYLLVGDWR